MIDGNVDYLVIGHYHSSDIVSGSEKVTYDSEILVKSSNDSSTLGAFEAQIDFWGKKRIRAIPTIEVGNERIAGYITKKQLEDILRSLTDRI